MTQNDIAYYNARKEAKDMRLKRKENKRHNLASEAADRTKAAASYLSAQAAQQNAQTNRAIYNLDYSKEYGTEPGETKSGTMMMDVSTGDYFYLTNDPSEDRLSGYRMWSEGRKDNIIIQLPVVDGKEIPNSYVQKVIDIEKGKQQILKTEAETTQTFWDTIKTAGSTAAIVVEAGSNLLFGKKQRNSKGGRD